jgi:XRE family transcriptional regulator, fatty acid utilization regulator
MEPDGRRKILAGAKLRKLRAELGLSQMAMALELGVSVSYLNLIERNQRPVTAQILIKLSETYAIDPKSFALEYELRAVAELEEVFSDPLFQSMPVVKSDLRILAEAAPGVVDAIKRLHRAYSEVVEIQSVSALERSESERSGVVGGHEDPIERVRNFLQAANNHFPELELRAEELTDSLRRRHSDLFTALVQQLQDVHGLRVQVMPVKVMGQMLKRHDLHRNRILISELVEPSGRVMQAAFHLGLLEAGDAIDALHAKLGTSSEQVTRLARISLGNYLAAAVMMPYGPFLAAAEDVGYDVEILGARFGASFEQVAHRLTTLSRPSARGVPFFMLRVDNAGNVSKRFSSGSFPFARFGGTCPRWNIHSTFDNPGRIKTQVIEMSDGAQWLSLARTVRRFAAPWGEPDAQFVVGLGCDIRHAGRLVYGSRLAEPTPIGINCRLCERMNCAQRAAPPLLRPLDVHENIRGFSPFDADKGR